LIDFFERKTLIDLADKLKRIDWRKGKAATGGAEQLA
jgi:hypothetical protein